MLQMRCRTHARFRGQPVPCPHEAQVIQETEKGDEYCRDVYICQGKLLWDDCVYSCTSLNKYIHGLEHNSIKYSNMMRITHTLTRRQFLQTLGQTLSVFTWVQSFSYGFSSPSPQPFTSQTFNCVTLTTNDFPLHTLLKVIDLFFFLIFFLQVELNCWFPFLISQLSPKAIPGVK